MDDDLIQNEVRYEQGFSAVPNELIRDERTTVYHIAVFAAIASHADSSSQRAYPSMSRLSKLTNASRRKLTDCIADLCAMGWIVKRKRFNDTLSRYEANVYELQRSLQGSAPRAQGVVHEVHGGSAPRAQELEPENNNQENNTLVADAVIDYLNVRASKQFRHTVANRKIVTARLRDGFTLDDCKRVVDNKCAEWLSNPKMNEYLRPATLFSPSKFEGYLNQRSIDDDERAERARLEAIEQRLRGASA